MKRLLIFICAVLALTVTTRAAHAADIALMPHVPDNATLSATKSTAYNYLIRDDFSVGLGAPPLTYETSNSACSLNAGAGDGGSQVPSADGKCWLAVQPASGVDVRNCGAKFDNLTNDTVAINACAAAFSHILYPPGGLKSRANGLLFGSNLVVDCNGSGITVDPSAATTNPRIAPITRTGFNQRMLHCFADDPNLYSMASTTLSGNAAIGATSLPVTSAAAFAVNMPIVITLDCGENYITKITTILGRVLTILDPIPACATSVVVSNGGIGGYNVNDPLVPAGGQGVGVPLTMKVTSVNGSNQITGVSLQAHGRYNGPPSNPFTVTDSKTNNVTAQGATFTATYGLASIGNAVRGAWGIINSVGASEGTIEDLRMGVTPAGLCYYPANGGQSEGEYLNNFRLNSNALYGLFKDLSVNTLIASNGFIWGPAPSGVPAGVTGVYFNDENPGAFATGGNNFVNVNVLQSETEWQLNASTLDFISLGVADTTKYYGMVCNACSIMDFAATYASFSGPGLPSTPGFGVGMAIVNTSLNVQINGLLAGDNASDLHVDGTGSVFLAQGSLTPTFSASQNITGSGGSLFSGQPVLSVNTGATPVGGGGGTIYLGESATAASTTELQVSWRNSLYKSRLNDLVIQTIASPPGASSYIATVRVNAVDSPMTCTIATGQASCEMSVPMLLMDIGDYIDVKIVSTGAAVATQFFVYGRRQ